MTNLPTPIPPYLNLAHEASIHIHRTWFQSVLREASSTTLRRIVSQRHRDELIEAKRARQQQQQQQRRRNNNHRTSQQQTTTAAAEVQLRVTLNDIERCYAFANRVGLKWSETLRGSGEVEVAEVLEEVLSYGRFLERSSLAGDGGGATGGDDSRKGGGASASDTRNTETDEGGGDGSSDDDVPAVGGMNEEDASGISQSSGDNDDCLSSLSMPLTKLKRLGWKDTVPASDRGKKKQPRGHPTDASSSDIDDDGESNKLEAASSAIAPTPVIGNPPPSLRPHPVFTPNNTSAVRSAFQSQIRTLDTMMQSPDGTLWPCGWSDAIEKAARRNERRIYLETLTGREKKKDNVGGVGGEEYEVVPRSMVQPRDEEVADPSEEEVEEGKASAEGGSMGEPAGETSTISKSTNATALNTETMDVDMERAVLSRARVASTVLRKRQRRCRRTALSSSETPLSQSLVNVIPSGREPSQMGPSITWSWSDIMEGWSDEEREKLVRTMVHDAEKQEEGGKNIVQGALKDVGSIHWFEQRKKHESEQTVDDINPQEEEEDGESPEAKKRRREYNAARNERLFPRVERKGRGRSKVTRASSTVPEVEEGRVEEKEWLELDLGECFVELAVKKQEELDANIPENAVGQVGKVEKMVFAFRSLEVSLLEG